MSGSVQRRGRRDTASRGVGRSTRLLVIDTNHGVGCVISNAIVWSSITSTPSTSGSIMTSAPRSSTAGRGGSAAAASAAVSVTPGVWRGGRARTR